MGRALFIAACVAAAAGGAAAQAQPAMPPPPADLAMMAAAAPSSDLDRSLAFYTKGLGMTSAGRVQMGSVTEAPVMFPGGGAYLMLLKPPADGPLPVRGTLNRVILAVPDLKALKARLEAAGYHLDAPIVELPKFGISVGQIRDPDGNHLELVQRRR